MIDTNGSFTIPSPQVLKGNDDSYVSIESSESNRTEVSSPVSINLSAYAKRARENPSTPIESQFKTAQRKSLRQARLNVDLNALRSDRKEEKPLEKR